MYASDMKLLMKLRAANDPNAPPIFAWPDMA